MAFTLWLVLCCGIHTVIVKAKVLVMPLCTIYDLSDCVVSASIQTQAGGVGFVCLIQHGRECHICPVKLSNFIDLLAK